MKQFIVLAAVLPILLIFVMQMALEQQNQDRIGRLQEIVHSAKEQARQEGIFTPANRQQMAARIAACFDISQEEVQIETDPVIRYRQNRMDQRELIRYRVQVPIEKIMAGNRLLGISDEENTGFYTIEGQTASEKLRD